MFVNHAHLMPASFRQDGTRDVLLKLMDNCGIEQAVCFAPFPHQYGDGCNWLASEISADDRLYGYGSLDPSLDPEDQVQKIADLGFKGIKLHPPAQKFEIWGEWSRRAYTSMEEHNLIADFHLGVHWHRLREYNPLLCDEIAWHYPALKMVYEHVGGWHYYRQVLAVITNNMKRGNHLYAGIASVLEKEYQRYWYLGPNGLNECSWQIGADLLIYGLDFPYNQEATIKNDLAIIGALDWSKEDLEKLKGGNLRRLLGLNSGEAAAVEGDPIKNPKN
jgi:predicted TIM-barrel fold metal-dependent hydrolase